jgi:hypothetical protein
VRGVRVYPGMPNHKIFKAAQLSWRLQNPDRWIVLLDQSETPRYRRNENCSGYAPNGGGRMRYSDDYLTFVAFRAEERNSTAEIWHRCSHCQSRWDQDYNSAQNLLILLCASYDKQKELSARESERSDLDNT